MRMPALLIGFIAIASGCTPVEIARFVPPETQRAPRPLPPVLAPAPSQAPTTPPTIPTSAPALEPTPTATPTLTVAAPAPAVDSASVPVAAPQAVASSIAPPIVALSNPLPADVVHRSVIYASMTSRSGATARMVSLLTTSETPIAKGTKALLLCKVPEGEADDGGDWAPLADVVVNSIDEQANVDVVITSERSANDPATEELWAKGASVKLVIEH